MEVAPTPCGLQWGETHYAGCQREHSVRVDAAGLCVYAIVSRLWAAPRHPPPPRIWRVRDPAFLLPAALVLTAAIQTYVYVHFGGLDGYVALFESENSTGKSSFTGWGWIFIVSESFPRLAFMAFAIFMGAQRFSCVGTL